MQKAGSATVDEGYAIAVDGNGDSYTTGYFTGNAIFGTTTLSSSGSTDIFVTKTDNQGNYLWAVKAGGSGSDRGLSIEVDAQGNSYITGFFNGTANFGSQQIIASGNQDVFIAKYNSTGTLQWVVKAGGTAADIGNGITVDLTGSVIVTGEFNGSASFGSTTLTASGTNSDAFTAKLDSTGVFVWAEQGSSTLNVKGIDVTSDIQGNSYVVGQFSGDITFDVTHMNTMFNAIFLVKYDSQGQEQWFRRIGAGVSNISNAITSDASGNIYLTGDFTGSLTFFNTPSNFVLTNTYSNKVFTAKYTGAGGFLWAQAAGSNSAITARDIAVDANGDAYIIGHFECVLDEFAILYGAGTFNTVGFTDIFVSKYSTGGVHQYSRNLGGRDNDYGYGIAVNATSDIHFTGSFNDSLLIPVSSNFNSANLSLWLALPCPGNSPYCSDPDYGNYYGLPSSGNLDIAIASCFDPAREPYDFYLRSGTGCSRPQIEPCLEPGCLDTLTGCAASAIKMYTHTCSDIGPDYLWEWTTPTLTFPLDTVSSIFAGLNGMYYVTVTSVDGCYSQSDSIYVDAFPASLKPTITDNKGININSTSPTDIELCDTATVVLTAGGLGNYGFNWTGTGLPSAGVTTTSITVNQSGQYILTRIDSNGCEGATQVNVILYPPLDSFILAVNTPDTMAVCLGASAIVHLYDSLDNPTAAGICLTANTFNPISTTWTISPALTPFGTLCESFGYITPDSTGLYSVSAMVVRGNVCETDTHYIQKDVYIIVSPGPVVNPFTTAIIGSQYICPGDTSILVATGGPNYLWLGPGVNGQTNDTVYVTQPGNYSVSSTLTIIDSVGCSDSHNSYDDIDIFVKPQPSIISSEVLICPNDSVQLTAIGGGTDFYWEGPNGHIPGDSIIYATDAGQYFCVVNDSDSCGLVTNTILLTQYSTPQLLVNGDLYICDGDSLQISVIANDSSIIEWQAPLSGSELTQTIYNPGTYVCKIISCGIITLASVDVLPANPIANITLDSLLCKNGSTTLQGNLGMSGYLWAPGGDTNQTTTINGPGAFVLTTNGCQAVSDTMLITEVEIESTIANLDADSVICSGESLTLAGPTGFSAYNWTPGDLSGLTLTVSDPGGYSLEITDTNGCKDISIPFEVFMPDTITEVNVIGNLLFCEGDSTILVASEDDKASYTWNPVNTQDDTLTVFNSGTYQLTTLDTFGCLAIAEPVTIVVEENDLSIPLLITQDTLICANQAVTLFASTPIGTVQWYDRIGGASLHAGEAYNIPNPKTTQLYYVQSVRSVCRSEYDTVLLEVQDCDNLFTPNVFTPNGDGINDRLKFFINEATCFKLQIYNRWGLLLFESLDMNEGWDGRSQQNGKLVSNGTYYYLVEYCKYNGERDAKTGYVTVLKE